MILNVYVIENHFPPETKGPNHTAVVVVYTRWWVVDDQVACMVLCTCIGVSIILGKDYFPRLTRGNSALLG